MIRSATSVVAVALTVAAMWAAPAKAEPFRALSPEAAAEIRLRRPTLVFGGDLPPTAAREKLRVLVGEDDVTEFAGWKGDRLRVTCPLPLPPGAHRARVVDAAGETLAELEFTIVPPGAATVTSGRWNDSIQLELDEDDAALSVQPHVDGRIAGHLGSMGYDVSTGHELRFDGDAGDVEEPDAILELERPGLEAALGTISRPSAFSGAEFLRVTDYRRALDLTLGTGAPVSIFTNLADALPTVTGERSFDQRLGGGSWRLPLGGERLQMRLIGLSAEDRGAAESALPRPERARLFGALVDYKLGERWDATLEVAASDREVEEGDRLTSKRDEALRLELAGALGEHRLDFRVARVGGRFANPADPRLALDREEAELSLSRRAERWSYELEWRAGRDGLEEDVERSDERFYGLTLGRRFGAVDARLTWSRQTIDGSGADSEQTRSQLTLGRSWRSWRFDLQAGTTDNERRGYGFSADRQDSGKISWRWTGNDRWTLRGSLGQNRNRDLESVRETRDLFVEPAWQSPTDRLRIALNLALSDDETPGFTDRSRRSARGSIGWQPGGSETWSLSLDLAASELDDRIAGTTTSDDSALLKITYTPERRWGVR